MRTLYESILDTEQDWDIPVVASNIRSRNSSRILDAVKYLHQYVLDTGTERIKYKKQIEDGKCYIRFGEDFEESGCIEIWSIQGTEIFYYYTSDIRKDVRLHHWNLYKESFLRTCNIRKCEVYELTGEFSHLYNCLSKMKVS